MDRSTLIFGICLLVIGLLNLNDPLTAGTNIMLGMSMLIYPSTPTDQFATGRKVTAYGMAILGTVLMVAVITTDFLT